MIKTISLIKRFICKCPLGKPFTTREVLLFGSRAAVDQALSRLVKMGYIVRLARGVFVKPDYGKPPISAARVARTKAEAFGKKIAVWGRDAAWKLGLLGQTPPTKAFTFAVNGSSSSFKYRGGTIYLRKTGARKMRLQDSKAGMALRGLWYLGQESVGDAQVQKATASCLWGDCQEIRLSLSWLPAWLSHFFVKWQLPSSAFRGERCRFLSAS
jgi:hypothetical protein